MYGSASGSTRDNLPGSLIPMRVQDGIVPQHRMMPACTAHLGPRMCTPMKGSLFGARANGDRSSRCGPVQVFLQYSGVSAWVPAGFAVSSMLPKLRDFRMGTKKDDKPMRQVRTRPPRYPVRELALPYRIGCESEHRNYPRLAVLSSFGNSFQISAMSDTAGQSDRLAGVLDPGRGTPMRWGLTDSVRHHRVLPAGGGAGLHGPLRKRQDQPAVHHRRPRPEVPQPPPPLLRLHARPEALSGYCQMSGSRLEFMGTAASPLLHSVEHALRCNEICLLLS